MDIITKLEYKTKTGKVVPLATSRNPSLARAVADYILGESDELTEVDFNDKVLNFLAAAERNRLEDILAAVGLRREKE